MAALALRIIIRVRVN